MKKNLLLSCVVAGMASAALVPSLAHAADGTINFHGSISDVTCNINGAAPGEGNITRVGLGDRISPSTFDKIGATSAPVTFNLRLDGPGCAKDTKVVIDFDPVSNVNPVTGNLKLVGTKPAEGVEIQISDAGNGASGKIVLGTPQDLGKAQIATVAKDGTATLTYTASYVSTAKEIATGSGNSFIRYSLAYH